jgi:hypothetical protein
MPRGIGLSQWARMCLMGCSACVLLALLSASCAATKPSGRKSDAMPDGDANTKGWGVLQPRGAAFRDDDSAVLARYTEIFSSLNPGAEPPRPAILRHDTTRPHIAILRGRLRVALNLEGGSVTRLSYSDRESVLDYASGRSTGPEPLEGDEKDRAMGTVAESLVALGVDWPAKSGVGQVRKQLYGGIDLYTIEWRCVFYGYRHLDQGINASVMRQDEELKLVDIVFLDPTTLPPRPDIKVTAPEAREISRRILERYFGRLGKPSPQLNPGKSEIVFLYRNDLFKSADMVMGAWREVMDKGETHLCHGVKFRVTNPPPAPGEPPYTFDVGVYVDCSTGEVVGGMY